jgi:hypothetical protein
MVLPEAALTALVGAPVPPAQGRVGPARVVRRARAARAGPRTRSATAVAAVRPRPAGTRGGRSRGDRRAVALRQAEHHEARLEVATLPRARGTRAVGPGAGPGALAVTPRAERTTQDPPSEEVVDGPPAARRDLMVPEVPLGAGRLTASGGSGVDLPPAGGLLAAASASRAAVPPEVTAAGTVSAVPPQGARRAPLRGAPTVTGVRVVSGPRGRVVIGPPTGTGVRVVSGRTGRVVIGPPTGTGVRVVSGRTGRGVSVLRTAPVVVAAGRPPAVGGRETPDAVRSRSGGGRGSVRSG